MKICFKLTDKVFIEAIKIKSTIAGCKIICLSTYTCKNIINAIQSALACQLKEGGEDEMENSGKKTRFEHLSQKKIGISPLPYHNVQNRFLICICCFSVLVWFSK